MKYKILLKLKYNNEQVNALVYFNDFVAVKIELKNFKSAEIKFLKFVEGSNATFKKFKSWFYVPGIKDDYSKYEEKDESFFYNKFREFITIDFDLKSPNYNKAEMDYLTAFYLINSRNNSYGTESEKNNWLVFLNTVYLNFGFIRGWRSYSAKIDNIKFYDPKGLKGRSGLEKGKVDDINSTSYIGRKKNNLVSLYSVFNDQVEIAEKFFNENSINSIPNDIDAPNYGDNYELSYSNLKMRNPARQSKWKSDLLKFFSKCAISNCNIKSQYALVASHIKPYSESLVSEKFDIFNGLILCANHDSLFDRFLISFNKDDLTLIASSLVKEELESFSITDESYLLLEETWKEKAKKYLEYHQSKLIK